MKTNLLKSIFISIILVMGVSNAWAGPSFSGGCVYFHNKGGWNDTYKYICISHDSWTEPRTATVITNTQLWYNALPTSGWTDAKYMSAMGHSSSKSASNFKVSACNHYTANVSLGNWGFNSGNAQMLTPASGSNGATLTLTYVGNSYTSMNRTITVKAKVSTDGGETYSEATSPGTLSASSYAFTSYTSCKSAKSLSSGKITCGYTANTTLTAADADEYTFDGWYNASGAKQTAEKTLSINPTADATYYAYYTRKALAEETHDVTISYMCGSTSIKENKTETGVGISTPSEISAPSIDGYKFDSWSFGTGVQSTDAETANPINITTKTSGIYTLTANYSELPKETVYFINTPQWTSVKAYAYSPENHTWPGVDATKEAEKIGEYEVYSYTATQGKYANVIFNGSGGQTADLAWTSGKYYIHNYNENTGWYTQAEAEDILVVPVVEETVYFVNNRKWSKVQAYAWNPTGDNSWPGVALAATGEKIAGFDVYSYTAPQGYINVIFNNKTGEDGVQSADFKWTDGKYYYMDAAANYAGGTIDEVTTAVTPYALATDVYLAGQMNSWSTTANEFRKATGEATTASVTVALEKQDYAFKLVIGGAWKGNNGTMQRGGDGVHEGGWSFDDDGNCTIIADIAGNYTFTWNLETKKLTVTYPELPTYTVTATAENGTVTGAGEYKHGTEATLVATPNAGYAFVNWKKGEEVVSSEASYTFTVTANTNLVAVFAPEVTHEVTVSYLCNSNPIPGHDATTLAVGVTTPSTITAPAITHYTFDSWTVGTGVEAVDAKANPIQITTKAEGDYTLAANYTKIELTYTVTVPEGTEKCYIAGEMNSWSFTEMTPQGNNVFSITIDGATNVHKYKYACQASWDYVEKTADGYDLAENRTYSAKDVVAKWGDPLATDIYLVGSMNSWNTTAHEFKKLSTKDTIASVTLKNLGTGTYEFKIIVNSDWLGNTGTMERGGIGVHEGGWRFENLVGGDETNCKLVADIDGEYTFTWNINAQKLTVTYPTKDYRLVYVESESGGAPYTKFHASQPIHYQIAGEKRDTISFYINKEGQNPAILLQQCEVDNGSATWNTIATQSINGVQGGDPGQAKAPTKRAPELKIGNGFPNIESSGVYNFVLEQTNNNAEHNAQILSQETHAYVGNYYIRTDAAEGRWDEYKTHKDNIMTHSQTVLTYDDYNYYFCAWVLKDQNVKYVVANDYSYCISDTLASDDIVTNVHGNLPADANVRYTWNSETNALKRAYLSGSGNVANRYLVLVGDENLKDLEGNTFDIDSLNPNEANFKDMENWLYQLDIKANKNTLVKLTADYNGKTQYFKGSADTTEQLIKGSGNYYALRLIYDFKTNYLVSGLVGNQTITDTLELEEVMIVRSHHEEAQTLKISNGSVTANKAYGVMTFNKDTLNGAGSQHERALYWVSFPFDVQLDKVFGFGNYGEHWIMEYYDGAERAEKGLWKEPTYSYWKFIEDPKGYILEAGKGYVLCLDLALLGNGAAFWDHENTEIALYFPSDGQNAIVIDNNPAETTTTVDAHTCTIERDNRDKEDSNWNIIGVPAYTNIAEITGSDLSYYQYDAKNNKYIPSVSPTFNSMHAYMVQFAGEINWREQVISLSAIAARKQSAGKDQYTLRLAIQQEGEQQDHTFIRLQEDKATAEFDMNYDLCKIINRGANIYSMINDVEVAANVLPMEERVIPLGLDIHETGNYTFAMPDGTDGITAILIDYETGKETNLLLADYTTELREGTNNGRFALRVRPNHVATEVETIIDGANGQIQKYIINGALYILNNGQLYDAQGRMVQP